MTPGVCQVNIYNQQSEGEVYNNKNDNGNKMDDDDEEIELVEV